MTPLLSALLPSITGTVGDLIDRFIPNKSEAAKAKLEMEAKLIDSLTSVDVAQIAVNIEEAKSDNFFVKGWRPACGWICAIAMGYHYVLQPFLAFALTNLGYVIVLPAFNMSTLETILFGMLGLGSMRSFDKMKGTSK